MRAEGQSDDETTTAANGHRGRSHNCAADSIGYQTCDGATQRATADHEKRRDFSQRGITLSRREAGANHEGNPRPHGVQLPHVTEVAEVRESHAAIAEN